MGWPLALGLLVAGLLIGQVWARGSRRLWGAGTVRPGLALGALLAFVAALVTGVRGLWPEALALFVVAAVLAAVARGRAFSRARDHAAFRAPAERMSIEQAASLLGVAADAGPEDVQAAYRRLIRMNHPDQGGTQGLAAQLNAARDVLMSRRDR